MSRLKGMARSAVLIAFACTPLTAAAQYSIGWSAMSGGGGFSANGAYALYGAIAQHDGGLLSGGGYLLAGGFWRGGGLVVDAGDGDGVVSTMPGRFVVHPPAPHPLTDRTVVAFDLPAAGDVSVQVYDVAGRVTRTLGLGALRAGRYQQTWDGRDDGGRPVAAGVYFVVVRAGASRDGQKVVVIR
jgi:hypothetical protein